jgi:hypothetical protein
MKRQIPERFVIEVIKVVVREGMPNMKPLTTAALSSRFGHPRYQYLVMVPGTVLGPTGSKKEALRSKAGLTKSLSIVPAPVRSLGPRPTGTVG